MALKKREFTPESGNVDTRYALLQSRFPRLRDILTRNFHEPHISFLSNLNRHFSSDSEGVNNIFVPLKKQGKWSKKERI